MTVQPKIHCQITPGRGAPLCSNQKALPALIVTAAEFDAEDRARRCGSCENARKYQRLLKSGPSLGEQQARAAMYWLERVK
jgi:hypothetical protein